MNRLDFSKPENRVLGNILRQHASQIPEQRFIVTEDETLSYREVYDRACRLAVGLQGLGVERDDRVCIFMDSSPDFVVLSLACNLIGAQWIPVNTDYRGAWLQQTLEDSDPRVLVTDRAHLRYIEALETQPAAHLVLRDDDGEHTSLAQLADRDAADFEPAALDRGEVASVMWTSGTTGRSKGVMQSHNAWVRSAISAAEMGEVQPGDVFYNCMPLYNSAAWVSSVYPALVSGVTVAMDPAFSASHFWERTRRFGATHVFTLGAMHMFLWNAPEAPDDTDNPVRSANMVPMPNEIHRAFCHRFGIKGIHQGFGQSEIMLLTRRYDDGECEFVPNSLGEPADDLEVALLDDSNQPVPAGEVGEFCVKPKGEFILFNGYFNNPEATGEAFTDGWYHTGDLGKQDADGNYFFVDRKKDVIRYKGRSVSSVAIESVARNHPAVKDVAAYGVTSDELASEHEIMLAVVRKPESHCSEEGLARFINQNAPYFFVPRYIEFLEALPMTPTQKVRKVELRQRGVTPATWDARAAGFQVER